MKKLGNDILLVIEDTELKIRGDALMGDNDINDRASLQDFIMNNTNGELPCSIKKDIDYLPTLVSKLDTYKAAIENDSELVSIKDAVVKLCKSLTNSIQIYYEGKIAEAFKILSQELDKDDLVRKMSTISNGSEYKVLYRGRRAKDIVSLGEMFHRPFSQRAFVPTERYSIPGLPCLYLAGSVYTCWKEIGEPSFKDFYVSRFEADDNVRVVDIAMHPRDCLIGEYDPLTYCKIWPLICACSFKVEEENRIFRSEYIIPQLLMQFVITSSDIDGIRYLSSYQPALCPGHIAPLYVDYAFPAPYENGSLYSLALGDKFLLTSALSAHDFNQLSAANVWTVTHMGNKGNREYQLDSQFRSDHIRNGAIKVCMDRFSEYEHTTYYNMEGILSKFEARKIDT